MRIGPPDDRAGVWRGARCMLAETLRHNTDDSFSRNTPTVCRQSGRLCAGWLRLDNRAELIDMLGVAAGLDDAQLVLAAYDRWRDDCPVHLDGEFALAIIDPVDEAVLLVRDAVGARPLYYRFEEGLLAASNLASALIDLPGTTTTIDDEWLVRYLLRMSFSRTTTAFPQIHKLPPGHTLRVTPVQAKLRRYQHWRDETVHSPRRDPAHVDAYREVLQQAVRGAVRSEFGIGCETSGGLDSSTVLGLAAQIAGAERVQTFGWSLLEYEPAYILATSQMHQVRHNHIFTARQLMSDAERAAVLLVLGYPEEHGNASFHAPFFGFCRQFGLRTLLSGFGGDEVVSNPGGHAAFELLAAGQWWQAWQSLPGHLLTRTGRLGKRMWQRRFPQTLNPRFAQALARHWQTRPIRAEVLARMPDLRAEYLAAARYDAAFRRVNDLALFKLESPYVATRMEMCSLVAARYGVDYRWPLLNKRLIQCYLSTPAVEKLGPNGIGRYLHRQAVAGIAPESVRWKPTKDMGVESVRRALTSAMTTEALVRQLHEQLEDLPPRLADIVDVPRMKAYLNELRLGHKMRAEDVVSHRFFHQALLWLNAWPVLRRP